MNKRLANIFALIMLETRLSFKDAVRLFKLEEQEEEFLQAITSPSVVGFEKMEAIKFLIWDEVPNSSTPKSLFEAQFLYTKFLRIIKMKDLVERRKKLAEYIARLNDEDLLSLMPENSDRVKKYDEAVRKRILRYQLKYALSSINVAQIVGVYRSSLDRWTSALEDEDLKMRLKNLNSYYLSLYLKRTR